MKTAANNVKAKHVVPQKFKDTPNNVFSPFNVQNLKQHVQVSGFPGESLRELDQAFIQVLQRHQLEAPGALELLMQLVQINIVQACPADHIGPRLFVCGLTFLKSALRYAQETAVLNSSVSSLDNLRLLEQRLKILLEDLPIGYADLPDMLPETKQLAAAN